MKKKLIFVIILLIFSTNLFSQSAPRWMKSSNDEYDYIITVINNRYVGFSVPSGTPIQVDNSTVYITIDRILCQSSIAYKSFFIKDSINQLSNEAVLNQYIDWEINFLMEQDDILVKQKGITKTNQGNIVALVYYVPLETHQGYGKIDEYFLVAREFTDCILWFAGAVKYGEIEQEHLLGLLNYLVDNSREFDKE